MSVSVIDRMVTKEVVLAFFAVMTVLLLIMTGERFISILGDAAQGEIPADVVLLFLGLEATILVPRLLPLSFFLAVLIALGRMHRDHEMFVLALSGVGNLRLLRTLFITTAPLVALVALLTLELTPWAEAVSKQLRRQTEQELNMAMVRPGVFNEFRDGALVLYAEELSANRRQMRNVFIRKLSQGLTTLLSAATGHQQVDPDSGDRYVVLAHGTRYVGEPGSADFQVVEFEKFGVLVASGRPPIPLAERHAKFTGELLASSEPQDVAELQWRVSGPLSLLMLALVALPMSRTTPGQGRFLKIFLAIPLYFVYANLQSVANAWLERGMIPGWLGMWWVHGAMFLVALALLFGQRRSRWRR